MSKKEGSNDVIVVQTYSYISRNVKVELTCNLQSNCLILECSSKWEKV